MAPRKLTRQAAFNKVARHLLRQNAKSTNKDGECLYRGPNGLRCAVGALIPRRVKNLIAAGKCLVAGRNLQDPNFNESVVLLAQFGPEGAMGLIIDAPTDGLGIESPNARADIGTPSDATADPRPGHRTSVLTDAPHA